MYVVGLDIVTAYFPCPNHSLITKFLWLLMCMPCLLPRRGKCIVLIDNRQLYSNYRYSKMYIPYWNRTLSILFLSSKTLPFRILSTSGWIFCLSMVTVFIGSPQAVAVTLSQKNVAMVDLYELSSVYYVVVSNRNRQTPLNYSTTDCFPVLNQEDSRRKSLD